MVVGRLQQRTWTAEDGCARSMVEVVAEVTGPRLLVHPTPGGSMSVTEPSTYGGILGETTA
jgi:single-stranded DNA-binding protein